MGEKPDGLTLERLDNNKGYSPENCKWATYAEQALNTRRNVFLEFNGKRQTLKEWAAEIGMNYSTLRYRVVAWGWPAEKALTGRVRHELNKRYSKIQKLPPVL